MKSAQVKENNRLYMREYRSRKTPAQKALDAEYQRTYRARNLDRLRAYKQARYEENRDSLLDAARSRRRAEDKEKRAQYRRAWEAEARKCPIRGLRILLRRRLYMAVRDGLKGGSAVELLGCSVEELKAHIEAQFTEGMTWENRGLKGWHLDHIRPLAAFDLSKPEELAIACHYTNLQPLWAEENMRKSARQVG